MPRSSNAAPGVYCYIESTVDQMLKTTFDRLAIIVRRIFISHQINTTKETGLDWHVGETYNNLRRHTLPIH
jgi:hypothetical protein